MQYRLIEINGLVFHVWFNYTKARNQSTGSIDSRLPDIEEEIDIIEISPEDATESVLVNALSDLLKSEE